MHTKWQAFSPSIEASQIGFCELSSLGALIVSGQDAETFLQGQLTVNLKTITDDQSQLGAHCNLKGRMQSLFRIFKLSQGSESRYLLIAAASLIPHAIQNLKKYALFSKVKLEQAEGLRYFGLVGEASSDFLTALMSEQVNAVAGGGTTYLPQPEGDLIICRLPGSIPRFMVILATSLAESFIQAMQKTTQGLSTEQWEALDIQAGIPSLYPNTEDLLLPHHVNLPELKGVSFDKGCYLGQEIIARMHYKGKIKRHMYRALLAESTEPPPCPGDQVIILDAPNEAPGIVVRSAKVKQGFELLVVLDEQYADFSKIRFKKADGPKLHRLDLM
ncbi:CAF17-like 4Fe-4S cluster assembly/insertion protein YgfZ [Candidatus Berkiella aquae]|nr:folate-binding protein YgfZ [Candidatus Berkiella aquae]MCS5711072.1 folate-binding protein YgfZ [Candidatus Berkiella aquae]